MTWSNYDDVVGQLRAAGLIVDRLDIGKLTRCRVESDREKRGWYSLHALGLNYRDTILVGTFGVWRGAEANAQKVDLKKRQLSVDQKTAVRERIREDQRRAEAERKRVAERAGERARRAWEQCATDGAPPYLARKGIAAHGSRVSPQGAVVLPMCDASGRMHGLQFIHAQKRGTRDKDFWPAGCAKQGHFFQLGPVPSTVLLIAEGYATAASIFEATGYPIAVAFDAGNLQPVAQALAKRYPKARILVCADDDYLTDGNPGCTKAAAAALAVDGAWVPPLFTDDRQGAKLTDFNDLHAREGLQQVRVQIEAKLRQQRWLDARTPVTAGARAATTEQGGAGGAYLRPLEHADELLERFVLIREMPDTVYDRDTCSLLPLGGLRLMCAHRHVFREFTESTAKLIVRQTNVGFDPPGADGNIMCNLFGGWPTKPKEGTCDVQLELLHFLCDFDDAVYGWVLKWLAYPIQRPGAKMQTALVFQGPQGTGKNLFFEAVLAIYSDYGRIIDQSAVDDKFNDHLSRKLFIIADEVVARQELYTTKNKLKGLITGNTVRINPKNMSAYDERNHVNLVFLSNEPQPLILEGDDRRYAVIKTPPKQKPDFYETVRRELGAGGVAALHHHLLHNVDIRDFHPWTPPPMTAAKANLIDLSMDSTSRFAREVCEPHGTLSTLKMPAPLDELYIAYTLFASSIGQHKHATKPTLAATFLAHDWKRDRVDVRYGTGKAQFMFPPLLHEKPLHVTAPKVEWHTSCRDAFDLALAALQRDDVLPSKAGRRRQVEVEA